MRVSQEYFDHVEIATDDDLHLHVILIKVIIVFQFFKNITDRFLKLDSWTGHKWRLSDGYKAGDVVEVKRDCFQAVRR